MAITSAPVQRIRFSTSGVLISVASRESRKPNSTIVSTSGLRVMSIKTSSTSVSVRRASTFTMRNRTNWRTNASISHRANVTSAQASGAGRKARKGGMGNCHGPMVIIAAPGRRDPVRPSEFG